MCNRFFETDFILFKFYKSQIFCLFAFWANQKTPKNANTYNSLDLQEKKHFTPWIGEIEIWDL